MDKLVNIGPQQRQTRKLTGYVLLAGAVVAALFYVSLELSAWWLLLLFLLAQNGILLLLEAKHGVCPLNALRGKQSMSGRFSTGQEDFAKPELLPKVKTIAYKDIATSTLYSIGVVLVVYLLAGLV